MTTQTRRAVQALVKTDPAFTELCKALYGDAVDADLIHADAYEQTPPPSRGGLVRTGVSKAVTISTPKTVKAEADGVLNSTKSIVQEILGTGGGRHGAPPGSSGDKVGRAAAQVANNPKKAALVGGGALAANQAGKKKGRREGYLMAANQGYAKRDTPDVEWGGTFSKFDDDKRQAFGFASVVKKDGLPVIDRQGDFVTPEDMETAAYVYVRKSRVGGDMHKRADGDVAHHVSDLIESVVFTPEKCAAMGMPEEVAKSLEGHWWVGYQIFDEDVWTEVKKKGRTGFSIHGRGKRADTTTDEVMGYS